MKTDEKENNDVPLPPNPDVSDIAVLAIFLGLILFLSALILVVYLGDTKDFGFWEGITLLWVILEIIAITIGSFESLNKKWRKMKEREKESNE